MNGDSRAAPPGAPEADTVPPDSRQASRPATAVDGRYVLAHEIGRGATGVVWDAMDLQSGQPVAVKVLHASLMEAPAARTRFRREVASAQSLDHPHTVRVMAHGETADGHQYLVMERLRGETLSTHLADETPLPLPRVFHIVAQILDAIAAAHRLNIVHRDLKPGNVVLIESGGDRDFVKVCDFGLAKAVDPIEFPDDPLAIANEDPRTGSMTTGRGDLCGTPEFMAPEQARGEPLDGRADLYSIAVLLFQAVTGRLPFRGRTPFAIVSQHMVTPPPRPSAIRPDLKIPPALENLILRGLAKDRRERPSSAEVFRADLLQIASDLLRDQRPRGERKGRTPEAATLPAPPPGARPRRAIPFVLLGGGAIAIAAAAIGLAILRSRLVGTDDHASGAVSARAAIASRPMATPPRGMPPGPGNARTAATATETVGNAPRGLDPTKTMPAPARSRELGRRQPPGASPRSPNGQAPAVAVTATPVRSTNPAPPAQEGAGTPEPVAPAEAAALAAAPATGEPSSRKDDDDTVLQRAEDLMADGSVGKACALVEDAAARRAGVASLHGFLGRCYTRIGRVDDALASYRKYLTLAPGAPDAPFVRAIIERKR